MKKSQSGRYWNFLYSLTPMGRREMQNSPGLTTHGEESSDPCEKIDLIGDDYQTSLLETLLNDPDTFVKKGEELKTAFKNYKGTLLNYQNSKLVLNHDGITDDNVEPEVDWPPKEANFTNSPELSSDDISEDEYSFDEHNDDDDDTLTDSDGFYINSNGPLANNIEILKEIATIKGYNAVECNKLLIFT